MSALVTIKNIENEIKKYEQKVFKGEMDESQRTSVQLTNSIQMTFWLERKFPGKIRPRGSSDISLVNLRECCHEFKKTPDDSISIIYSYLDGRSDPFLVIEVIVSHESTDLLLREAEVYLNKLTKIEYAIMVQFSKVPEGNESIRIIVAQRSDSNPIIFYGSSDERETKEHQIIKEHSFKCKGSESKFLSSRNHEKDLKKILNEKVAQDYDIQIIYDILIEKNNISPNIRFFLDASRIVSGTIIPMPEHRLVEINIPNYLIEDFFSSYDRLKKKN
ncbi:unnamed protein product [Brachionus calyciflorus]|uniref:Uncharacterized protein n=1 Tax=Brachionus calyciflorus TaxID=104777 RepID=A0A814RZU3_9BILA|nr:unnamed protein product [Brachionus calyciflorus]